MIKGINTWEANARRVNYIDAKADGIEFAITRLAEGLYLDANGEYGVTAARNVGMIDAGYQAIRPEVGGEKQAETFMAAWDLAQPSMPPVADVEVDGDITREHYAEKLWKWREFVTSRTGHNKVIWYTSKWCWENLIGGWAPWAADDYLWICDPNNQIPVLPKPWTDWTFWQYGQERPSWMKVVNLRHAKVDVDFFKGTIAELRTLAGLEIDSTFQIEIPKELEGFTLEIQRV